MRITHAAILRQLEKEPFIYLIDHWEECAIRIGKDESRAMGLRFWQKFSGKREFESHPDCELVHSAILESGAIIEDGRSHRRPRTEIVTKEEYLRY
jgi:hypothetical protein